MGILYYTERVRKMFGMTKLIPRPSRKTEEYHEANWDTGDMNYKEKIICKVVKEGLTEFL